LNLAKLDLVTFRLANIVGPRNLSGALPIFYKRISKKERCDIADARRDFVDVRDIVPVVLKAVDGVGSGPYHLSSGKDISIHELFNEISSQFPEEMRVEPNFVENSATNAASILLDPSRTTRDFGEMIFRSLTDTVSAAIDYYREYGVEEDRTHFKKNS